MNIAELESNAVIKRATGEAEAIRLRAMGEAEAIRATGNAKADAYKAGVQALGSQGYTAIQVMQIIGDQQVRVVPDVSVSGQTGGASLTDALLGMILRSQTSGDGSQPKKTE